MNFKNKVALITGGAQGIGAATARRLAKAGAIVWAADVDDGLGRELESRLGAPHRYVHLDVTDPEAWKRTIAEIMLKHGGIDVLFLNAGIMFRPRGAPALNDDLIGLVTENFQRYQRVMAITCDGSLLGVLHGLPALEARGGGAIVAMSSDSGLRPHPWDLAYGMSRRAVLSLVDTMAPLLAKRDVVMTALCPAGVDSGISPADFKARRLREGHAYATPDFAACAVETILVHGKPGEVWMARHQDHGYWVYPLPAVPASVDDAPGEPRVYAYEPM